MVARVAVAAWMHAFTYARPDKRFPRRGGAIRVADIAGATMGVLRASISEKPNLNRKKRCCRLRARRRKSSSLRSRACHPTRRRVGPRLRPLLPRHSRSSRWDGSVANFGSDLSVLWRRVGSGDSLEQTGNEGGLRLDVAASDFPNLSLPHHRHRLVARQGSSCCPEAAEAKAWPCQAFNPPMVLFRYVVQVLALA